MGRPGIIFIRAWPLSEFLGGGDVQPYIVLGDALKKHGHRVRIATHETFRQMVKDAGLGFYSIGGDPTELMSYMVRSRSTPAPLVTHAVVIDRYFGLDPGLLPGTESLLNGDIPRKRQMITEVSGGLEHTLSRILPFKDLRRVLESMYPPG